MSIFDMIAEDTDPEIQWPNRYCPDLKMWFVRCPCGASPGQHDGFLDVHFPRSYEGHPPVLRDPWGYGATCRYSRRSLTLVAAIARDEVLTEAERYVSRTVQRHLEYLAAEETRLAEEAAI